MGDLRDVHPVKLICAVLWNSSIDLENVIGQVTALMGPVASRSEVYPFDFTTYYRDEMGEGLQKVFLSFQVTIHPAKLPEIKSATNRIEADLSEGGKRRINLDPGYMTTAKLVLASTKDFAHRIFIGDGIYGDLQLQYRHGRFHPQHWTFPDYQTETALGFFERIRDSYYQEVKAFE